MTILEKTGKFHYSYLPPDTFSLLEFLLITLLSY